MYRILIVDRQVEFVWALQRYLSKRDESLQIYTTAGGPQAKLLLEQVDFDLLITELKLNNPIDGFELVDFARNRLPELRVIITSTLDPDHSKRLARRVGADAIVQKPFGLARLHHTIQLVQSQAQFWASKQFQNADLCDVIEMLCQNKRTAIVNLRNEDNLGLLVIDHGELFHAKYQHFCGIDALFALANIEDAEIHVSSEVSIDRRTIFEGWSSVLRQVRHVGFLRSRHRSTELRTDPLSFSKLHESLISSVIRSSRETFEKFPLLREHSTKVIQQCPGILAYGLFRGTDIICLTFKLGASPKAFTDPQLVTYLDQLASIATSIAKRFDTDIVDELIGEYTTEAVILKRVPDTNVLQFSVCQLDHASYSAVREAMLLAETEYSRFLIGADL